MMKLPLTAAMTMMVCSAAALAAGIDAQDEQQHHVSFGIAAAGNTNRHGTVHDQPNNVQHRPRRQSTATADHNPAPLPKLRLKQQQQQHRREYQAKIIGGNVAERTEYPFFAQLAMGCGASLITRDVVLSAAHCVEGIAMLGSHVHVSAYEDWDVVEEQGLAETTIDRFVTDFASHPNFEWTGLNDIAVIKLSSPVPETIPTVKLNADRLVPEDGQDVTVIGLGISDYFEDTFPDLLHEVELQIINFDWCNAYSRYGGSLDRDAEFCASTLVDGEVLGGKDSCNGDSGGPIFIKDGTDRPLQVGIVSHGEGCAFQNYPGVYATVSDAYGWIKENACAMSKVNSELCGKIGVQNPEGNCASDEIELLFDLHTDEWSDELGWELRGDRDGFIDRQSPLPMLPLKQYTIKRCLPADQCYTLQLTDTHGDG